MKLLGEFYQEKILSLPKKSLTNREIPGTFLEDMTVEKDLFGWKLYYTRPGRKSRVYMECRSEEEARYLKVLIGSGFTEIFVPKNDEYLKSILPELEYLKKRVDEILGNYLETLTSRRIREELKYQVFAEITQYGPDG